MLKRKSLSGGFWLILGAVALAAFFGLRAEAASSPVVYSTIEGQDSATSARVVVVVGNLLTKVKTVDLVDPGTSLSVGTPVMQLKSKNMLALLLPESLPQGTYLLHLSTGSGPDVVALVTVTKGQPLPGSVTDAVLDPALKTDLDDAATVGGKSSSAFVSTTGSSMTGALSVGAAGSTAVTGSTSSASSHGVLGQNTAGSGTAAGVRGDTSSATGFGVEGVNTATTGVAIGVHGKTASTAGSAVYGESTATTGGGIGVEGSAVAGIGIYGHTADGESTGVYAYNSSTSSIFRSVAVEGESDGEIGLGVFGIARGSGGVAVGGLANGAAGTGVYGEADSLSTSSIPIGVQGVVWGTTGIGVWGQSEATSGNAAYGVRGTATSSTGTAVRAQEFATSGANYGVHATCSSPDGVAVYAEDISTSSGLGTGAAIWAKTSSPNGYALRVEHAGASAPGVALYCQSASGSASFMEATATTGSSRGLTARTSAPAGIGVEGSASDTGGLNVGVSGRSYSTQGNGVYGYASAISGSTVGVYGYVSSTSGTGVKGEGGAIGVNALTYINGGNALVASYNGGGVASTTANNIALFQAGGVNQARIDNTGRGYFNGGTATTGADFAERVAVDRPAREFGPGDVIVIDTAGTRRFTLSSAADSPLVVGVYSTKPAMLAGLSSGDGEEWRKTEIPMAMTGIVPCKVCDEGGEIRVGDLLVTSSVPGHAKRAPENPKAGTVLGKALAPLARGKGSVEVYLTTR